MSDTTLTTYSNILLCVLLSLTPLHVSMNVHMQLLEINIISDLRTQYLHISTSCLPFGESGCPLGAGFQRGWVWSSNIFCELP